MSSTLKTSLIAATIALSVGLFAVQAAHAGPRHYAMPFTPFDAYAASADAYDDDTSFFGEERRSAYGSDVDEAVSAVQELAHDYLDADVGEVLDLVGE